MRIRHWLVGVATTLLVGCGHTSAITPMYIGSATGPNASSPSGPGGEQCGWVEVSEERKQLFSSIVRQFDDSLFYCCPGDDGKTPECREAKWMQRDPE